MAIKFRRPGASKVAGVVYQHDGTPHEAIQEMANNNGHDLEYDAGDGNWQLVQAQGPVANSQGPQLVFNVPQQQLQHLQQQQQGGEAPLMLPTMNYGEEPKQIILQPLQQPQPVANNGETPMLMPTINWNDTGLQHGGPHAGFMNGHLSPQPQPQQGQARYDGAAVGHHAAPAGQQQPPLVAPTWDY